MNKKIKLVAATFAAFVTLTMSVSTTAHAVELTDSKTDGSGNFFAAGEVVDTSAECVTAIENECFLVGQTTYLRNVTVDGSAFVAGANVNVDDALIGSSLFVAGSEVSVDAVANNNIWAAGSNVKLSEDTSVKGLHAAGASVTVGGEYTQVDACGGSVYFDAKVDGDVNIEAENVTIGPNADVTGNINVTYSTNLNQDDNAKVPNLNVTKVESSEEKMEEAARKAVVNSIVAKIKMAFYMLFANSVIAVILALLFNSSLKKAYEYCTTKTGSFIGFGALIAIMAPTAIFIAAITIIGAPAAGLALMVYATVGFGCKVFTFGSLVRELIFTHTKSRLHPIAETVLAVLPLAIVRQLPVIKSLVGLACAIYTWGYIVLAIYDKLQKEKQITTETE
ncbi:MAG: hypothetical protein MJ110_07160 [Lachnospiraceae bacterium]|nr:hypothetical protein [Lachnospiraceae bacterium]